MRMVSDFDLSYNILNLPEAIRTDGDAGIFFGIAQMDKKYKQANTMLNIRITMQVLWYTATMASRVRRSAVGESSGRAPVRRCTIS